jgi:hypothetical protein
MKNCCQIKVFKKNLLNYWCTFTQMHNNDSIPMLLMININKSTYEYPWTCDWSKIPCKRLIFLIWNGLMWNNFNVQ